MGTTVPPRFTCQNVQPLQASAPCTCAPTVWITLFHLHRTTESYFDHHNCLLYYWHYELTFLPPLRGKVDRAQRETDEGTLHHRTILWKRALLQHPLIRRFAPPSPARGEGRMSRFTRPLVLAVYISNCTAFFIASTIAFSACPNFLSAAATAPATAHRKIISSGCCVLMLVNISAT